MKAKTIYTLNYYDSDDGYKGVLCSFDEDTDLKSENFLSTLRKVLNDNDIIDDENDDEEEIMSLLEAISNDKVGEISSYGVWLEKNYMYHQ